MTGLLLVNLGTPDAPTVPAVRRYLREFLWDHRVIDIHPVARAALLYLIILPTRPRRSAAAYRAIWGERGSPLRFHSEDLAAAVAARLGQGWRVELAMRYGQPALAPALRRFVEDGVRRVVVMPLYPQYASSSTGSTLEAIFSAAARMIAPPALVVTPAFYDHPGFLDAQARLAAPRVEGADHVLFSFHGLPERHVMATDHTGAHCLASGTCCDAIVAANAACYRAQCFATAQGLARRLGLSEGRWSVSFQSRLGRDPWIKPYTDHALVALAEAGVRDLAVICPSFVADCLETVEEIGIRAVADFTAAGGERLRRVPCVNSEPDWADAVAELARSAAG